MKINQNGAAAWADFMRKELGEEPAPTKDNLRTAIKSYFHALRGLGIDLHKRPALIVDAAKIETPKTHEGKKKIIIQTKPAGRKVDAWNSPAFDILYDGKEDSDNRAYAYWCEAQGILYPDDNNKKAFKKAMDRVHKRRNR